MWLHDLADTAAQTDALRKYGVSDAVAGFRVGDTVYRVVFDGFDVTVKDEGPCDFVISAPASAWDDLRAGKLPSLNTLVATGDVFTLTGDEQVGIDCFYRYNASIQAFVELGRAS